MKFDIFSKKGKKNSFVQAAANQLDWFKENLDRIGHHIDQQDHRQRQTLLRCACKEGFFDLVDVNLSSALHLAAYGGHIGIVEYLLSRGGNSHLINKWGMTAEQEGIAHMEKPSPKFFSRSVSETCSKWQPKESTGGLNIISETILPMPHQMKEQVSCILHVDMDKSPLPDGS